MPYDRIDQLPDSVRNHLPTGAQRIYKEAFNHLGGICEAGRSGGDGAQGGLGGGQEKVCQT